VELKLMRELIRRKSNQPKKVEIVNYYYQWQILKAKGSFTVYVKTTKRTGEKITLKGTTGMARIRGSGR
jgi:hypothetical protein